MLTLHDNMQKAGSPGDDWIILKARAAKLPRKDYELLVLYHEKRLSYANLGKILGRPATAARRHLKKLLSRIKSRDFLAIYRAINYLPSGDEELARRYFFWGQTHMAIVGETGRTLHAVRRRLVEILARAEMFRESPRRGDGPNPPACA